LITKSPQAYPGKSVLAEIKAICIYFFSSRQTQIACHIYSKFGLFVIAFVLLFCGLKLLPL